MLKSNNKQKIYKTERIDILWEYYTKAQIFQNIIL